MPVIIQFYLLGTFATTILIRIHDLVSEALNLSTSHKIKNFTENTYNTFRFCLLSTKRIQRDIRYALLVF